MKILILAAALAALGASAPAALAADMPEVRIAAGYGHDLRVDAVAAADGELVVSGQIERRRMAQRSRPFGDVLVRAYDAHGAVIAQTRVQPVDGLMPRSGGVPFRAALTGPAGSAAHIEVSFVR
jgi:hypothetical protein